MDGKYNLGDIVLSNWTLKRLIGEGSFGRVFEAERIDFGHSYSAAVKIITIPKNETEIRNAYAEGMNAGDIASYFNGVVDELANEFTLMSKLKGNSNIVSYEDHVAARHSSGFGWDVIIRMELLKPLTEYEREGRISSDSVRRLGIDMCRALERCWANNIVHRDIKPENIFISEHGDFKLGDFGIARTVEKTTGGLSTKGTYSYMAPEVYKGLSYGPNVDIYSLGIVLYRMLNDSRTPFLPDYPAPITHNDREKAFAKRIEGAPLPAPKNAYGKMAEIVLRACAYDTNARYSSPMQMRQELEAIENSPIRGVPIVQTNAHFADATSRSAPTSVQQIPNVDDNALPRYAHERIAQQPALHTGESSGGAPYARAQPFRPTDYYASTPAPVKRKSQIPVIAILAPVIALIVIAAVIIMNISGGGDDLPDVTSSENGSIAEPHHSSDASSESNGDAAYPASSAQASHSSDSISPETHEHTPASPPTETSSPTQPTSPPTETQSPTQPPSTPESIGEGLYTLRNVQNSDYVLNIWRDGTPERGDNVTSFSYVSADNNQIWMFERKGGAFTIAAYNDSNLVLNVYRSGPSGTGDNVNVWPRVADDANQEWIVESAGTSGWYIIRPVSNRELALTSTGNSNFRNENNVEVRTYQAGDEMQLWELVLRIPNN